MRPCRKPSARWLAQTPEGARHVTKRDRAESTFCGKSGTHTHYVGEGELPTITPARRPSRPDRCPNRIAWAGDLAGGLHQAGTVSSARASTVAGSAES